MRAAECLCRYATNDATLDCQDLRQTITVFIKVGCQDGLARFEAVTRTITVGCYTVVPRQGTQSHHTHHTDDGPVYS